MPKQVSKGKCAFCGQTIAKNGMSKHLAACEKRHALLKQGPHDNGKTQLKKLLHLQVDGYGTYWLHLEIPADAALKHLDQFLRDIWLECCGHLSAFTISGQRYSVYPMGEYGERGMAVQVGSVFKPGVKALHEYDFGTTTELTLKYVSERAGEHRGNNITLLARNEPPVIPCVVCGKPATQVCAQCVWGDEGWLCKTHARKHECGEEMLLPIVNSPRVGMCGYTGQDASMY
jgi:hypothetical protein